MDVDDRTTPPRPGRDGADDLRRARSPWFRYRRTFRRLGADILARAIEWGVGEPNPNFHREVARLRRRLPSHRHCRPWSEPDRWPVVVAVLSEGWHEYEMTATALLEGILSGSIPHANWSVRRKHTFESFAELRSDQPDVPVPEPLVWVPSADVRIEMAEEGARHLYRWLTADETLSGAVAAFSVGGVHPHRPGIAEVRVTLHNHLGLSALGASVAAWLRSTGTTLTGRLLCNDDAAVSVEQALPDAVEAVIRRFGASQDQGSIIPSAGSGAGGSASWARGRDESLDLRVHRWSTRTAASPSCTQPHWWWITGDHHKRFAQRYVRSTRGTVASNE